MKRLIFILLLIVSCLKVFSQKDSCFHYKVDYQMYLNFNGPTSYEALFYFNKAQSLFEYKEIFSDKENDEKENNTEPNIKITIHDKSQYTIKNDRELNLTIELVPGFSKSEFYDLVEPIPIIDWVITEEVKKINQHNCSKATCSFRGRNYTAWFTTEVQTNFGPLKLNGLPGLILELSDDTKEVVLYAKSIKKEDRLIENKPSRLKSITRAEYKLMIFDGMKKIEETAKAVTSRMDRGVQASFKISMPKSIEMDYFQ